MAVNHGGRPPRAVIHKRILDTAASRPDASVEALAEDLAGASPELVERVLDKYGDPAESAEPGAASSEDQWEDGVDPGAPPATPDTGASPATPDDGVAPADSDDGVEPADAGRDSAGDAAGGATDRRADANDDSPDPEPDQLEGSSQAGSTDPDVAPPAPDELTEKQRLALGAIAEHPDATQAELAERLDVSSATVNKRVNAVEGFDWADRHAFVERLFGPLDEVRDDEAGTEANGRTAADGADGGTATDGADEGTTADGADGTDEAAPGDFEADEAAAPEADEPAARDVTDDPEAAAPTVDDAATADQPAVSTEAAAAPAASDGGQLLDVDTERAVEQLQERVARLEEQLGGDAGASGPALDDAELLAKVVRAVVADDAITDDEEVRVLETLLEGSPSG